MSSLLDTIETKQKTRQGIIDFATKKQVIFYDLTHNNDPRLRLLVALWRSDDDTEYTRFSIYAKMEYPSISLPEPMVLPINAILNDIDVPEVKIGCDMKRVSISTNSE